MLHLSSSTGYQSVIITLQVIQTNTDQILIYWELTSISSRNYTQSIIIESDEMIVFSKVLEKHVSFYLYASSLVPCKDYNITVSIETGNCNCSDSITTTTYISGKLLSFRISDNRDNL